jgi:hypothetical protein
MMAPMKLMKTLSLAGFVCALSAGTAFADVQLTIHNGQVSLVAKDATVRQILTEWARVGQTKIVNVERIPGGPITLELQNMPEDQALELLLRSVSGYVAAPRPMMAANMSRFDRILVMPTSAAPKPPVMAGAAPQPAFNPMPQPQQTQPMPDDDADDERPAPNVNVPMMQNPQRPVFNPQFPPQSQEVGRQVLPNQVPGAYPQPITVGPNGQPIAYPGAPGAVATPGMIAPTPAQPGQPGQPGVPVVRRPGGPGGQN